MKHLSSADQIQAGFSFCWVIHEYVKALKNVTDFGLVSQHNITSHEMKYEHVPVKTGMYTLEAVR